MCIRDSYSRITFADPASNSLPGATLAELAEAIDSCVEQPSNTILVRSAGDRAFCGGASFDELMAVDNEAQGLAFFSGFARVINAMRRSPKLILCRVQGKAVGGGVGLVAAADYSIANKYASIRLSELALGIGPFVIGPAVERKMGRSAFRKLALTPDEWQTAAWARDHGLYDEVFDEISQVDDYIDHLIAKWADYSPAALQELKKVFWDGCDDWEQLLTERAAISGRLVLSDFTRKAIGRFKTT